MKKIIAILALLCIAAGDAQIEGWKPIDGEWVCENRVIFTSGGTLECDSGDLTTFTLSGGVTIKKVKDPKGPWAVAVFWGWTGKTFKDSATDWETRNQLLFWAKDIEAKYAKGPESCKNLWHAAQPAPVGAFIPFKIAVTKRDCKLSVGKTRVSLGSLGIRAGRVALHAMNADVEFKDIKIAK